MTKFFKIALASVSILVSMSASAGSLNGTKWQSVDENGVKKAVVKFYTEKDGSISGKIIKLNDVSRANAVCSKCTDGLKDEKIVGLRIIWNLESAGANQWDAGLLVNPEDGEVYKGKVTIRDNGNKLELRGYLGIDTFVSGRSQTWTKIN